jgi:hypothetical protein
MTSPRAGFLALTCLLTAPAAPAQEVPISGAELRLTAKTSGVLRVMFENASDTPLVQIEFRLVQPGERAPNVTLSSSLSAVPLPKGQRRTIDIDLRTSPNVTSAWIAKAGFADGTAVGLPAVDEKIRLVSVERLAQLTYSAVITNLRPVPIEAFTIEELAPHSTRVTGATAQDFCVAEPSPARPGMGRIEPGEQRHVDLRLPSRAEAVGPPSVRLALVVFDDLRVEGDGKLRDELFSRRDLRARSYEAAIAAVREAQAQPAGQSVSFLEARHAQWKSARADEANLLADVLQAANPERAPFDLTAKVLIEAWERQLSRLRRHQNPR